VTLLAKRLRLVRTQQGLSQEQLGNRTATTKHLISQVEQGRCGLTNPRLFSTAQALGVSEVVLYGVALDVCDRYAVEGLLERFPEIAVSVVVDAVRALDEGGRAALLAGWEAQGVTPIRTKDIVAR